ncbi:hypothetical protein TURU_162971 [Turdus rufiventris]|nr:hypothetical protein TURU_162971 [Turdus rufiventris]
MRPRTAHAGEEEEEKEKEEGKEKGSPGPALRTEVGTGCPSGSGPTSPHLRPWGCPGPEALEAFGASGQVCAEGHHEGIVPLCPCHERIVWSHERIIPPSPSRERIISSILRHEGIVPMP